MGNEVVAVNPAENLPVHSLQEMDWLGKVVAGTQLFGQAKSADCLAIVAMCHQERMSWTRFSQTYHWIKGRPTKRADAILADFAKIGGKKKVHERTPERASCTFALDGDEYTSTISWEDARREPFAYDGREADVVVALANGGRYPNGTPLALKAKYQTPRARMQMLWARCVSDGVRTVAPQCCCGIYTPEETDDFADAPRAAPGVPPLAPTVARTPADADPSICPAGTLKGRAWDSMDDATLESALRKSDAVFTPAMKDRIRKILDVRRNTVDVNSETKTNEAKE